MTRHAKLSALCTAAIIGLAPPGLVLKFIDPQGRSRPAGHRQQVHRPAEPRAGRVVGLARRAS